MHTSEVRLKTSMVQSKINFAIAQIFDQVIKMYNETERIKNHLKALNPNMIEAFSIIYEHGASGSNSKPQVIEERALTNFLNRYVPQLMVLPEDLDAIFNYLGVARTREINKQ